MRKAIRRYIRYPIEALATWFCLTVLGAMPVAVASSIGGFIGRTIGPLLPVNARARKNIDLAMPGTTDVDKGRIIRGMWDNLGRVTAEYAHLPRIAGATGDPLIDVDGLEHVACVRDGDNGGFFISAHCANWEAFALGLRHVGLPIAPIYRRANNPFVDRMVMRARRLGPDERVEKGLAGARKSVQILRDGGLIGVLMDQKMNDGIPVPFFGHEAMSAPATASLALKFRCPIVPMYMERVGGCRFKITFYPAFSLPETGDRNADVLATMVQINRFLEERIREHPEQWLWLHHRWPETKSSIISSSGLTSDPAAVRDRAASETN